MALRGKTSAIRVEGLDKALRQLNTEVKKIRFRTKQGMIKAGLLIQRESQKRTPVDMGNLKASAFTVWAGRGTPSANFTGPDSAEMSMDHSSAVAMELVSIPTGLIGEMSPQVSVGYSAAYAVYVHEDLEASHTKSKTKKSGTLKEVGMGATKAFFNRKGQQFFGGDVGSVGEAKFLEKAVVQNLPQIIALITGEVT